MDLPKKLQMKPGTRIKIQGVPKDVMPSLTPLPEGTSLIGSSKGPFDGALIFCRNHKDVEEKAARAVADIPSDGLLWLCYPKGTSGLATDISRDRGWEAIQKMGLRPVRAVSINDTWSALRWRPKSKVYGQ